MNKDAEMLEQLNMKDDLINVLQKSIPFSNLIVIYHDVSLNKKTIIFDSKNTPLRFLSVSFRQAFRQITNMHDDAPDDNLFELRLKIVIEDRRCFASHMVSAITLKQVKIDKKEWFKNTKTILVTNALQYLSHDLLEDDENE